MLLRSGKIRKTSSVGHSVKPEILDTTLKDVKIVKLPILSDERGQFFEVYRAQIWQDLGIDLNIRQISQSFSREGVVRGLHFQNEAPMGKAIRCLAGAAYLGFADVRKDSPTFGKVFACASSLPNLFIWAPPGIAVGFASWKNGTVIEYLCSAEYNPEGQSQIHPLDPDLGINWQIPGPVLSQRDRAAQSFASYKACLGP